MRICYGLREVRVGEASNPGPPKYRARRRVVDSDDDVLTSLEHELTLIDPFVTKWIQWFVAPSVRCVGCVRTGPLRSPQPELDRPRGQSRCLSHPVCLCKGDVEISSGEEVLQRPNMGRDVAARICRSAEQLRPTSVSCQVSTRTTRKRSSAQSRLCPQHPLGRSVDPSTPVQSLSRTDSLHWKSLVPVEDWC